MKLRNEMPEETTLSLGAIEKQDDHFLDRGQEETREGRK